MDNKMIADYVKTLSPKGFYPKRRNPPISSYGDKVSSEALDGLKEDNIFEI